MEWDKSIQANEPLAKRLRGAIQEQATYPAPLSLGIYDTRWASKGARETAMVRFGATQ